MALKSIKATDLKAGDKFYTKSGSAHTVLEVMPNHRSEYAGVLRIRTSSGREATVAITSTTYFLQQEG